MSTLQVLVNTAQKRIGKERIQVTLAGSDFATTLRSNTWTEPITNTTMLQPYCLEQDWEQSASGNYARLGLSDFGLSTGWTTYAANGSSQVRLWKPDGMGASSALSTGSFGVNRGFYLSFFTPNTGIQNDNYSFEFGWSDGGNGDAGLSLRFRAAEGVCEVWKNGLLEHKYSVGGNMVNEFTRFIVLPFRRRELLVYSINSKTGFVHVFSDISESATSPVIANDEKVWFFVAGGNPVNVEIAPLRFKSSGYVKSKTYSFGKAPLTGQTLGSFVNLEPAADVTNARVFAERGSYVSTTEKISTVSIETLAGSAFTPNGTIDQVRVKVEFIGDSGNGYTPFLRGLSTFYQAEFVDTDNSEEFDITGSILSASLSVSDDPGGTEFSFRLRDPQDLTTDVADLLTSENIPAIVKIGTVTILDGVLSPVKFEDAFNPETRVGGGVIRDRTWLMKDYRVRDRIPLDGLLLSDSSAPNAVSGFYNLIGVEDSEQDLDDVSFVLRSTPGEDSGEFSYLIEAGESVFSALESLVQESAFGFFWGFVPTATGIKAIFKDPETLPTTPVVTLYRTPEDAVAAGDPELTYDGYTEEPLPLPGNELRVTGIDNRRQVPIVRWKEDSASKNPATAPSLRPDNWLGFPKVVGFQSPKLTSAEACENLIATAFPKITARNYAVSLNTQMLFKTGGVPVWRGDMIEIDGGRTIRVTAFNVEFIAEQADLVFRSATYTGGTIFTNLGGRTASEIAGNWGWYFSNGTVKRLDLSKQSSNLVASVVKL